MACWWCNSTTMTSERAREPAAGPVSPARHAAAGPASPAHRAEHLRRVLRTIPGIYLLLSTYTSLCYYIITLYSSSPMPTHSMMRPRYIFPRNQVLKMDFMLNLPLSSHYMDLMEIFSTSICALELALKDCFSRENLMFS